MTMRELIQFLEFLGGAALIVGALVYIAKRVVDGFLQTGVATFKANLEKAATENLIKFKRLHHERAEVVRELYRRLTKLDIVLSSTLSPLQWEGEVPLSEKVENLVPLHRKFNDFYQANKIFFSAEMCTKIDNFNQAFLDVYYGITTFPVDIQSDVYERDKVMSKDRSDLWKKARKLHENEMREIRNEIEREFRNLLGVAV